MLSEPELKLHVDIDPGRMNRHYRADIGVRADLRDFLTAMAELPEELAPELAARANERRQGLAARGAGPARERSDAPALEQSEPVNPAHLMAFLERSLPRDALLFTDIGGSMLWAINRIRLLGTQDFYVPMGYGSMGSGIGAAIGARSAMPDRPVVCLTGDCALLMQGAELFTARNHGIGVKFIVLNDGGHGTVEHGHRFLGLNEINVRFARPVDFVSYGQALGVGAFSARSMAELRALPLEQLFASPEPVIIDVAIDAEVKPPLGGRARGLGIPGIVERQFTWPPRSES